MRPRELTRVHLEALVVARALISEPAWILARLDRDVVSAAAIGLLEQMAGPSDELSEVTLTKAQQELAARVRAITVYELLLTSIDDLIAHVNALPARPVPPRAWERDLATIAQPAA